MYRTWWKHIDPVCPSLSCFHYSSLFPLQWPSSTTDQPFSSTSVLAESLREYSVQHSHPGWLGSADPRYHWWLFITFVVYFPVLFGHIFIIQVTITVKPISSVGNAVRCTILTTFGWMTVESLDSADIQYLWLFSREVLLQTELVGMVIYPTIKMKPHHHARSFTRMLRWSLQYLKCIAWLSFAWFAHEICSV